MTTEIRALYTRLPAIDRLLRDPAFSSLLAQHGHSQVVTQLRQMLDEAREQIRQCQTLPDWSHDWLSACAVSYTHLQRFVWQPPCRNEKRGDDTPRDKRADIRHHHIAEKTTKALHFDLDIG